MSLRKRLRVIEAPKFGLAGGDALLLLDKSNTPSAFERLDTFSLAGYIVLVVPFQRGWGCAILLILKPT